jgi:hypothetical protein
VNGDDCSFLFVLADAGISLLLCMRQKKKINFTRDTTEKKLKNMNSITMNDADGCQTENVEMQKRFICCKIFLRG